MPAEIDIVIENLTDAIYAAGRADSGCPAAGSAVMTAPCLAAWS